LLGTPGYADLAQQVAGLSLRRLAPACWSGRRPVGFSIYPGRISGILFSGGSVRDRLDRPFGCYGSVSVTGASVDKPGLPGVFEIDESFIDFFKIDLVDDPYTFLATDLFRDWQVAGGGIPGAGECVGFKVPLFLGEQGQRRILN